MLTVRRVWFVAVLAAVVLVLLGASPRDGVVTPLWGTTDHAFQKIRHANWPYWYEKPEWVYLLVNGRWLPAGQIGAATVLTGGWSTCKWWQEIPVNRWYREAVKVDSRVFYQDVYMGSDKWGNWYLLRPWEVR